MPSSTRMMEAAGCGKSNGKNPDLNSIPLTGYKSKAGKVNVAALRKSANGKKVKST
jgi:hypothetical protein